MAGGARFSRLALVIFTAVLLPMTFIPGGSAGAAVTAPRTFVSTATSHAAALAARRALVKGDTSFAAERRKGNAVAVKLARAARRFSTARLGSIEALARARGKHRTQLPKVGQRPAVPNATPLPAASSNPVEGVPEYIWLVGPGGTFGPCLIVCNSGGVVSPGEPVTVYTEVNNESTATVPVTVTWTQQCGTPPVTVGTETVNAPPTGGPGAIASASFTVQDTCPGAQWDYPNFEVSVSATPQVPDPITGGASINTHWNAIQSAQLMACNCSRDSATPTSAQADAGDPVDTVSGAYAETITDATLNSAGYPLTISRSYSSADTASGALGPGWSLPWQASLAVNSSASGDVTFTAENGDQYVYVSNGSAGFYRPPGALSVLAEVTDSSGNVTGYTLTTPQNDVLTFDPSGRLVTQTDSTGRGLSFSYDSAGQVSSITDAAGQTVTLTYNGALLSSVTVPNGQEISYGYTNGLLTSVTDPGNSGGAATRYSYNSAGLLASVQDPDGNTITNTYDSSGRVVSQQDGAGNVTTLSYTATSGGLPETDVTDPNGGITSYVYSGGMLVFTVDPMNGTTEYIYNDFAEPIQVTDPMGNSTSMSHDASGNILSETDPLGHQRQWTY